MNKINKQHIYEDTILNLLYLRQTSISTNDFHAIFGNTEQEAHNMVSNRHEDTNFINIGYIKYNEKNQTVSITDFGKNYVENKYKGRRA